MAFVLILGIAAALAMDCFAVTLGLACGARGLTMKQAVRMAAFFGGFQFVMPVAGWLAGDKLLGFIRNFDHWVAFGLLALIGGRMIYESFGLSDDEKACRPDQTQGMRLVVLCPGHKHRRLGGRTEPGRRPNEHPIPGGHHRGDKLRPDCHRR